MTDSGDSQASRVPWSIKPAQSNEESISVEERLVRTTVLGFQTAYKTKNKPEIFKYFTEPLSKEDKDMKGRLLEGKDTDGNIGGPTLFETNTALNFPDSFTFSDLKKEGDSYRVSIDEKRKSPSGSISDAKRTLIIIKVGSSWLVDKYQSLDYEGKYTGFLF